MEVNKKLGEKGNLDEIPIDKRLDQIKFWKNRLYLDGKLKYGFFILYFSQMLLHIYFIGGLHEFLADIPIFDIIIIASMIFALFMESKIKGSFEDLIVDNKAIFESDNIFEKYLEYVYQKFKSKTETYLPVILFIIWFIIYIFMMDVPNKFLNNTYQGRQVPSDLYWLNITKFVITKFLIWLPWILTVGSALILIIYSFQCINKLGTEEFPLHVTYQDLKIGAFESIGKFVISMSIPAIILSTFFSITGLINIFILESLGPGYGFLIASLLITTMFSLLLYKNTLHIHEAITKFKFNLKYKLIKEIQEITTEEQDSFVGENYQTIKNIHDYYDRIDEINDWPFNPKSLRKLFITFSSSILPLILSFLGLV